MRTVRRLYFYAVSLVSLEVVLWGLIGLVRSAITPDLLGGGPARLAQALSLILVGVPVFWIHWNVARDLRPRRRLRLRQEQGHDRRAANKSLVCLFQPTVPRIRPH